MSGFDQAELGRRLKRTRESQKLTLKLVESESGISATHISEIERGKTTPTLKALLRLAGALGRDPAYFLEEEELGDVSVVRSTDRLRESLPDKAGTRERLTPGIPGGQVDASMITLSPRARRPESPHLHDGCEALLLLEGTLHLELETGVQVLVAGDSVHFSAAQTHQLFNPDATTPARFFFVSSCRDAL